MTEHLSNYDMMYHRMNNRTKFTTLFFNEFNLNYIYIQITFQLSNLFQSNVIVPINNEFFIMLENYIKDCPNYLNAENMLFKINCDIISQQIKDKYNGLREKKLFQKWFIEEDRPLTIAPPMLSNGRHRESKQSNYHLTDPRKKNYLDFLSQTNIG